MLLIWAWVAGAGGGGECFSPSPMGHQDVEPHCQSQLLAAPCQGQDEVEVSPPHPALGPARAGAWESSSPCQASAEARGGTDQSDVYPPGRQGGGLPCFGTFSGQSWPLWQEAGCHELAWPCLESHRSPLTVGFLCQPQDPSMGQGSGSRGQTKVAVVVPAVLG